jgi:hypothetical protein
VMSVMEPCPFGRAFFLRIKVSCVSAPVDLE